MKAVLQHRISGLLERRQSIQHQLGRTYTVDQITIARLKRDIRREIERGGLAATHEAALWHEIAYLLSIEGRYEEAHRAMAKADVPGFDPIALIIARSKIDLLCGAILEARRQVESINTGDLPDSAKRAVLTQGMFTGSLKKTMEAAEMLGRDEQAAGVAAEILSQKGIDDLELTKMPDTACRVIRAGIDHPILGYKLFAMEGEGILYRFLVRADVEQIADLNEKIIEALIEKHDGPLDSELSIIATPWYGYEPEEKGTYHVSMP